MQATKPDAWEYKEYDTNNNLRARHVWTFLPDDLKYFSNLKDVHHIVITPMYKNETQSQEYNKENKYNSKKLAEAFGGL
jgi:hypothetical protein